MRERESKELAATFKVTAAPKFRRHSKLTAQHKNTSAFDIEFVLRELYSCKNRHMPVSFKIGHIAIADLSAAIISWFVISVSQIACIREKAISVLVKLFWFSIKVFFCGLEIIG
jgi:hypothetical protein